MAEDIESLVKSFAKDMDKVCADLRKARMEQNKKDAEKAKKDPKKDDKKKDDKKDPPVVTWALDPTKVTKERTPEEQAAEVAAGRSWVCWSSHMAGSARHVIMKVDGKVSWEPKKTMGDDFNDFKKGWGDVMKRYGLKNYKGGDGWADGDEFHLELPDSKMDKSDKRVGQCFEEYAKLTRKDGKAKNEKFETEYAKDLEKYLAPYAKKEEKK